MSKELKQLLENAGMQVEAGRVDSQNYSPEELAHSNVRFASFISELEKLSAKYGITFDTVNGLTIYGKPFDSVKYDGNANTGSLLAHPGKSTTGIDMRQENVEEAGLRSIGKGEGYIMKAELNIERHLSDVVDDPSDMNEIREAVYTLAHDAVMGAGGSAEDASRIGNQLARAY